MESEKNKDKVQFHTDFEGKVGTCICWKNFVLNQTKFKEMT